jgi:hypothetical protein
MSKIVKFHKELDRVRSKKAKSGSKQRKKTDIAVDTYCTNNPLDLPSGVKVHRLFYDKGEPMPSALQDLFSEGLPRKGLTSVKSIVYNHVLAPSRGMERREMFQHLADGEIYGLKSDIVELITDPFWKSVESSQKFGSYDWDGYKSLIPNINQQYSTHGDDTIPWWVEAGIQAAVDELMVGGPINPISLEESIAYCKTDTNSGFPVFTSKPFISLNDDGSSYSVLNDEVYSLYYHMAKVVWSGKAHNNLPAVLFKRVQPGEGNNSKKRIVECIPRGVLWAEGMIWRPILERMRTLDCYSGYMHHSNGLGDVIHEALDRDHVSSLDYTSYDATVGRFLRLLFLTLADRIPSAAPLFLWCMDYYRACLLITPHGLIEGEHGLFSGMFGTSFLGSLLNRGLVLGCQIRLNSEPGHGSMNDVVHLAFGDDGVLSWNGSAQIDTILGFLMEAGMQLNRDKQEYCGPGSPDKFVMFQACYWRWNPGCDDHCVPVYSLVRCAARLAFIEYLDVASKLIYGAGYKVDEVECPEVVGPIVSGLIAKLMEAEYHPNVYEFIDRYQGTWLHYLNPLTCVTDQGLLRFLKSEFSYVDDTDAGKFMEHPVCVRLTRNLTMLDDVDRIVTSKAELIHRGSGKTSKRTSSSEVELELSMELLNESGFSDGLIESIILRVPSEAMFV